MAINGLTIIYDEVKEVSNLLKTKHGMIITDLKSLQQSVSNLTQHGFQFKQSSAELDNAYTKFDVSLTQAAEGIKGFAELLENIIKQAESLDSGIGTSLKKS
ncbi:hypothetical protein AB0P21_40765 [Kribbella sp. NPDC056861]|uniref:hypothetical protein n=1 Tax=Kribbella sp. NPDC056861 TaxID=3154857 RepID=UPI00343C9209